MYKKISLSKQDRPVITCPRLKSFIKTEKLLPGIRVFKTSKFSLLETILRIAVLLAILSLKSTLL